MSDIRAEFEAFISLPPHEKEISRFPGDGSSAWPGSYKNLIVDLAWDAWQASRQALEGEPVLWWDENDVWDLDECVKKTPTSRHTIPLYTHPASADVSDWEIEAKRAFWTGLEIGASMGAVSIAPRWNEYIAKRKEEMGQGVTGGGV